MILTHVKIAYASIKSAKVRSFLTMLGVIIGVSSVIITVALGQGVKNQVLAQVSQLGEDVVIVRPGQSAQADSGSISGLNFSTQAGVSTLTAKDVEAIKKLSDVKAVSYTSEIAGLVTSIDKPDYNGARIMAVSSSVLDTLDRGVQFGEFFDAQSMDAPTVIIGSDIAAELFKIRDPIGRTVIIRGQEFTVRGVLEPVAETPFGFGPSGNNVVYVPDVAAKNLVGGTLPIGEIQIRAVGSKPVASLRQEVRQTVYSSHNNQEDFTVLTQDEYVKVVDQLFKVLTSFVAAIAAISLLVGGIGIMNIMLVSVSERTREIGVRKAVGATNRQILSQFLVESTFISVVGGIFGALLSLLIAFILRVTTPLHPSLSIELLFVSIGIATIVGIIFGVAPAIQAARKDPIVALRHE